MTEPPSMTEPRPVTEPRPTSPGRRPRLGASVRLRVTGAVIALAAGAAALVIAILLVRSALS